MSENVTPKPKLDSWDRWKQRVVRWGEKKGIEFDEYEYEVRCDGCGQWIPERTCPGCGRRPQPRK